MIRPGVPSVRLWTDAAAALQLDRISSSVVSGIKTTISGFTPASIADCNARLDVLYVLEPVLAADGPACVRTRLPAVDAAIALAQQSKLADSLIGMSAAGAHLAAAARLATIVPVWKLAVARDFARLPSAIDQLMAWQVVL